MSYNKFSNLKKYQITSVLLCALLWPGLVLPYGKNKVVYESANWKVLKSLHIDLYYPEEMIETAKKASLMAEEAVVLLSNKLNHELSNVIPIILYPSIREFQGSNIIPNLIGEGTGGFTEALKSRVAIPFTGSYVALRHVLSHELVHAFQFDILFGGDMGSAMGARFLRLPLWIMEGMAEYFSLGWDETVDMAVRDAILHEALPTLDDLNQMRVATFYSIYKFGQSVMYFIADQYGEYKISEILKDIRDSRTDLEEVIKEDLAENWEDFSKKWRRWLRKRYWPFVSHKKYYDEQGVLRTNHLKKWATFNFKPTVSPDGKKIAYFTNEDFYTNIVIRNLEKTKEETEESSYILVSGNRSDNYEELRILTNRISWSKDGRKIFFVTKANGKDSLFWVDAISGSILKKYSPPLRFIGYPSLDSANQRATFIGMRKDHLELFVMNLADGKIDSVVNNLFDKMEPVFSPDGKYIFYISNRNKLNNIESRFYSLFRVNIANGEILPLSIPQADLSISSLSISHDGNKLVFSGSKSGFSNIYTCALVENEIRGDALKVTDLMGGGFYPSFFPDDKKIIYNSYYIYGYDIVTYKGELNDEKPKKEDSASFIDLREFPATTESFSDSRIEDYRLRIMPEILGFNLAYSSFGFLGIVQTSFSDIMGDQRLYASVDYFGKDQNSNFQLTYLNLKHRVDFIGGIFRNRNFINIITLTNLNEIWNPSYYGTESLYNYGFFVGFSYPMSRYLRWENRFSSSRFEQEFYNNWPRVNIGANLHQVTTGLVFDNVLWGLTFPVDGWRGEMTAEKALDLSGKDYEFYRLEFDIRRYFVFFYRYSLAFRLKGGTILGQNSSIFKYEIGGYGTIRGHAYKEYQGPNMFLFNAEFRFPFVDLVKFAWPFPFSIGGLAGVWFFDMGSAWESYFQFTDNSGKLITPKASYGCGLRMVLLPFLILRIDFATPWDFKTSQPMRDWKGEFSIGFDY